MIHPSKLSPGDKIAAISLSWGGPGALPHRYEAGKRQLEAGFGVTVVETPHALREADWLKKNPKARAGDLMGAFADPSIKAIFSTIGGDDSIRVLPLLDLSVITSNPKIFLGMSDTTVTHMACYKAGLASFYGPGIMQAFAENGAMFPYVIDSVRRTLFSAEPIGEVKPDTAGWTVEFLDWANPENQSQKRTLNRAQGWKYLQGRGLHRGRLLGGCIEVLDWLRGTPVWPAPEAWKGAILFIETSEEAPPAVEVLRMLRSFTAMGITQNLAGMIFGRPGGETPIDKFPEYDAAILQAAGEAGRQDLPIVTRMDFGHTDPVFILPYGAEAEIDCDARRFSILESAVMGEARSLRQVASGGSFHVASDMDVKGNLNAGDSWLLALDIGTSTLKLAVYEAALKVVHASRVSMQDVAPSPEGELDADRLWHAVQDQIVEVGSNVDLQRVAAIGITGMAESGCLIDANDQAVTPMLLWHDRRGIRQAAALRRKAGGEFARLTGLRTTSVRSINKWKWMVDHGAPPEARWCGAPEWIALRLTGRWQTDATLAVRTGAFDVLRGEFSSELLELAGAASGLFAPVHGSSANPGGILPAIARDLGLPASTRVVIAGHDDIVAAYGAGGARGDLIDSGGTAEGLVRIVDSPPQPSDTVRARMAMTQFYLPGTWALIAGAGSTGALMDRVAHMLGRSPADLDVQAAPPGKYPTGIIDVKLTKESLPEVKLDPHAGASEVWSAVLDLVCDRVAQTARRLGRIAGPPTRLVLIGGAARSRELVRRKSERLGLPAVVMGDIDATTRGAAALAQLSSR